MDPSILRCFLKIVFMDQTVHLMVIVYVFSQLSLSVTNTRGAREGPLEYRLPCKSGMMGRRWQPIRVWSTVKLWVLHSQHSTVDRAVGRRWMGIWHHSWGPRLYKSPKERGSSSSWNIFSRHWGDQQLSVVHQWIQHVEQRGGLGGSWW